MHKLNSFSQKIMKCRISKVQCQYDAKVYWKLDCNFQTNLEEFYLMTPPPLQILKLGKGYHKFKQFQSILKKSNKQCEINQRQVSWRTFNTCHKYCPLPTVYWLTVYFLYIKSFGASLHWFNKLLTCNQRCLITYLSVDR